MSRALSQEPDRFHFAIAVFTEEGTLLDQAPVEPDFEPPVECARFSLVSRGMDVAEAYSAEYTIVPEWDQELGQPYLSGIRIRFSPASGIKGQGHRFSTSLFRELAHAAAWRLVEAGTLDEGSRFRYWPMAYRRTASSGDPSTSRFRAKPRPPDFQVAEGDFEAARAQPGMAHGTSEDGVPVLIPSRVSERVSELAVSASDSEVGGILIGHLRRDLGSGKIYVEVTGHIPAEYAEGSATQLAFTPDAWTDLSAALDLRKRNEIMVGWYHSHLQSALCPGCSEEERAKCRFRRDFFSRPDRVLHRTVFPRAFCVALVVNVVTSGLPILSLFGWKDGSIATRTLHTSSVPSRAESDATILRRSSRAG
jgi:proteasome lid subunit RPN8/RPN11